MSAKRVPDSPGSGEAILDIVATDLAIAIMYL